MKKKKRVTAAAARRVFNAYETGVFNPALAWLREMELPAGVYEDLPSDLRNGLDDLREYLLQVVQAAEQDG